LGAKVAELRATLARLQRRADASEPVRSPPPRTAFADELDRAFADGRPVATVYKQGGRTFLGFNPPPSTVAARPIVPPEPAPVRAVDAQSRDQLDYSFGSGRPPITRVGNKKSYGVMSVEEARAASRKLAAAAKGAV
jgi:hypothetical protein